MNDEPSSVHPRPAKSRRSRFMKILFLLIILSGAAWTAWWYTYSRLSQWTDDAYTAANVLRVTPQVSGRVLEVLADDTHQVTPGQVLVRLDNTDARLALERAKVDLATAVRTTCQLRAREREIQAVINMRRVDMRQAEDNLKRREVLGRRNAIGVEELHHARNSVETATAALAVAQEQWNALNALLLDTVLSQQPAVKQAAALLRERWLALQRTEVKSPVQGQVAKRSVQAGEVVAAGTPLMAVTALNRIWVDANFKEGQLIHMRIGQPATVGVDMYGKKVVYRGHVAGFSAGTGSTFSLLPPQNATGNWIKIVQRVPVRIEIDLTELDKNPLLIGLSAHVTVDTSNADGPLLASVHTKEKDMPADMRVSNGHIDFAEADVLIQGIIVENSKGQTGE